MKHKSIETNHFVDEFSLLYLYRIRHRGRKKQIQKEAYIYLL